MLLIASTDGHDPAMDWVTDNRSAVIGTIGGGITGFVMGAAAIVTAGAVCQRRGDACFGAYDAPLIGAAFVAPVVGLGTGAVVGVVGALVGAGFDNTRRSEDTDAPHSAPTPRTK
jgi:hypothetical protein